MGSVADTARYIKRQEKRLGGQLIDLKSPTVADLVAALSHYPSNMPLRMVDYDNDAEVSVIYLIVKNNTLYLHDDDDFSWVPVPDA